MWLNFSSQKIVCELTVGAQHLEHTLPAVNSDILLSQFVKHQDLMR